MKRLIRFLLFAMFVVTANLSYAQVDLGAMGGLHWAKNKITPAEGFSLKYRLEFGVGAFANFPLSNSFSIQTQPMYLRRGGDIAIHGFTEIISVYADYIEIPVFARYTFGSSTVRPYLFAGPSLGFLLNAKQVASFIPQSQENVKQDTKSTDFSLVGGGGLKFNVGTPSLYVQAMYLHGTKNIDNDASTGDYTETIRSRGIAVMFGVSWPLGGKANH